MRLTTVERLWRWLRRAPAVRVEVEVPPYRSHHWSGWPGGWCLDCGAEDQREICLAGECGVTHVWIPQEDGDPIIQPPFCGSGSCTSRGRGLRDPYRRHL